MPRESLSDLIAFLAVARERSFTRAAAKLGVSQSAQCSDLFPVIPAKAESRGNRTKLGILAWMPAFAGMTRWVKASAGWYDTP
jgi:hypothetical protein